MYRCIHGSSSVAKFVEPLSEDNPSVTLTEIGIDFAKELLAKGIDPDDDEEGASNEND